MEGKVFFNASDYEIQYEEKDKETYDAIYIVKKVSNNAKYIAKVISTNNNFDGNEQMLFLRESLTLCKLNHPAIAKFIGVNFKSVKDPNQFNPTFITEYFPNGSIKDIINKDGPSLSQEKLTATQKYIILLGICDAIQYLHDQGITSLNLKPNNIFLDYYYYPRISDFYFSKLLKENTNLTMEGQNGRFIYLAPEILLNKDNNDKSVDVYSFSMIAYEIITEKVPYSENDSQDLRNKILKGYRPTFPEFVPLNLQNLLSKCWSENPEKRPSFKEIFEILSQEIQLKEDSIDKEEIEKYLSILNEYHMKQSNNHNICNFEKDINDLKATLFTFFGKLYQSSDFLAPNNSKKIEYFSKAANFGNSDALNILGTFYYNGDGVEQDFIKAKEYYEKSANLGNTNALNYLGSMYYNGEGVEQNFIKAKELFEKTANLGNSDALNFLGTFYYDGDGVEQDFIIAKEYYEKSAKLWNSDALNYLGSMYYNGEGVEQDFSKAKELFERAANLQNSDALNYLGIFYYNNDFVEQDFIKSKEYFEKSAKLGNSDALIYLGSMYYNGEGVEQDSSKAKELFEKAAILGNSDAYDYLNIADHPKSKNKIQTFTYLIALIILAIIFFIFKDNFLIVFDILLDELNYLLDKLRKIFIYLVYIKRK